MSDCALSRLMEHGRGVPVLSVDCVASQEAREGGKLHLPTRVREIVWGGSGEASMTGVREMVRGGLREASSCWQLR